MYFTSSDRYIISRLKWNRFSFAWDYWFPQQVRIHYTSNLIKHMNQDSIVSVSLHASQILQDLFPYLDPLKSVDSPPLLTCPFNKANVYSLIFSRHCLLKSFLVFLATHAIHLYLIPQLYFLLYYHLEFKVQGTLKPIQSVHDLSGVLLWYLRSFADEIDSLNTEYYSHSWTWVKVYLRLSFADLQWGL